MRTYKSSFSSYTTLSFMSGEYISPTKNENIYWELCARSVYCYVLLGSGIGRFKTHWGWVMHICVGNLTIIDPDNGLSPCRRQAIIRTNAGMLLIEPLRTNISEISIEIHTVSFKEMHLKMASDKWRPFYLGLNVLTHIHVDKIAVNSKTIFSDAFSRMKSCIFWLLFHWILFLGVQLIII